MEELEPITLIQYATEAVTEPSKVVVFKPTAGFRPFKQFFVKEAVKHPAKANLHMIRWIIEKFTKQGDVILDPMAGTYSTCIMASLLGRNSIGVEYEDKFYKMGRANVELLKKQAGLEANGKIVVLKGDARKLSQILAEKVDTILTSPPYANRLSDVKINDGDKARMGYRQAGAEEKDNLGNLKYGNIDAIITSPPYAKSVSTKNDAEQRRKRLEKAGYKNYQGGNARCLQIDWRYSEDKNNIGNKKYGNIDAIVTSPPYRRTRIDVTNREEIQKNAKESFKKCGYFDFMGKRWTLEKWKKANKGRMDGRGIRHGNVKTYGKDPNNIGNLKPETYLSAMLQVYSECYKVLKPNGLMILITKNFIRKKKVVRLDYDTIKLCQKAGFVLIDRWYRKLTQFSFWVNIYYKKYGLRVEYEDILVFTKKGKSPQSRKTSPHQSNEKEQT